MKEKELRCFVVFFCFHDAKIINNTMKYGY